PLIRLWRGGIVTTHIRTVIAFAVGFLCTVVPDTASAQSPVMRDAWFTHTQTVPGQRYGREDPSKIWGRATSFTQGKDPKVVLIMIANDWGAQTIAGARQVPDGRRHPFDYSLETLGGGGRWCATSLFWDTDKLAAGKHVIELPIDRVKAGPYEFEVKREP